MLLYFQYLQKRSGKINVHAVPDLRIAGGRLGDGFYHSLLFTTAALILTFCARSKPIFDVRDQTGSLIAVLPSPVSSPEDR